VQQLLDWQQTDAGKEAAAAALAAAQAAETQQQQGTAEQLPAEADSSDSSRSSSGGIGSRRRRRSTSSAAVTSNTSGSADDAKASINEAAAPAAVAGMFVEEPQQPPRNAAAAAADSLTALLQQLQEQPDNAALLAVARNSLELHVKSLLNSNSSTSSSWHTTGTRGWVSSAAAAATAARTAALQETVADLASRIQTVSSPASIAALATACYSREVQSPVLAAAMSEAVAAVAPQLGPQEVYRVLRLLVEHLGDAGADGYSSVSNSDVTGHAAAGWARGDAGKTLRKGFTVLAQALIGCCGALAPMQLAEAVALLARHQYDDAWG
jgi:hypothetical protein